MLISLALDYQVADVATRERFHVSPERLPTIYEQCGDDGLAEIALFGTCNRTEIYAWVPSAAAASLDVWHALLARRWMPNASDAAALLAIATRRSGAEAARHAIRVAVGLESQILGDGQILGQFRTAYRRASDSGVTGPMLSRLFETALRAGKRVQTETLLGSGKSSIGAQAAALAARRFSRLTHTRVVVVGCGKTGERVARQLVKLGARDVVLLNRTLDRATLLAAELGGRSAPLDSLNAEIAMADIAIVATGAEVSLVHAGPLAQARSACATSGYPLLVIDLAMPRNVQADVAALPGVTLVDLDALRPHVSATEDTRRSAMPAAAAIVDAELKSFSQWLASASARDAIRPMRDALTTVCRRELAFAAGDEAAARLADRIVAKVLARPMTAMRDAMARGEPLSDLARTLHELFAAREHVAARIPQPRIARVSASGD